jgi:hypothetical protein
MVDFSGTPLANGKTNGVNLKEFPTTSMVKSTTSATLLKPAIKEFSASKPLSASISSTVKQTSPNPLFSDIKNSLSGSGSLSSSNVHIGSIQSNIARALTRTGNSNAVTRDSLLKAQNFMSAAAGAKTASERQAALTSAKNLLLAANNSSNK